MIVKVWITKYALTQGIIFVDGVKNRFVDNGNLYFKMPGSMYFDFYSKKDWHTTWESARDKAEDMRARKNASLKKQIEKNLLLKFENPELKQIAEK